MKKTALASMLLAAACAPAPLTQPDVQALSRGGTFDLSQCTAQVRVEPSFTPRAGEPMALGVCGEFNSDNTTHVVGDLRVKSSLRVSAPVHVTGSLAVGAAIVSPNTLDVGGDLQGGAAWVASAPAHVGGDATIQGALNHANTVQIDGTLTATQENGAGQLITGQTIIDHVNVAAPLDCNATPDVHGLATELSIDPLQVWEVTNPTTVTLGCGTYGFERLAVNNTLTLHVTGPTKLLIRGTLHVAAPMVIDVAPGGWLELIVDGPVELDNTLELGPGDRATVLAASGDVRVGAPMKLDGLLIAPKSSIAVDNTLDLTGSALVGPLRVAAPLNVAAGAQMGTTGWPAGQ